MKTKMIRRLRPNRFMPRLSLMESRLVPAGAMMPRPTIDLTPVAKFDRVSVNRGQSVTLSVLSNDVDPEGPIAPNTIVITQQPTNATLTVNANGTVTFKQDGSDLPFDSFRYKISDQAGQLSNEAIALIDIKTAPNQAPIAGNDTATVARGQSVTVSVLGNDSDTDGSLNNSSVVITQQPTRGTVAVNANGTITYTHDNSSTTSDTFRYTVQDNRGQVSSPATVTLTITSLTTVAVNDTSTVAKSGTVNINVAGNDVPPTGSTLNLQSITITQQPINGTLTNLNNGQLSYTHNGSAATTDSFRYTIRSASGIESNEATVSITISTIANNQAPVAVNDSTSVARSGTVTIPVSSNDSDADGELDLGSIAFVTRPAKGDVTANANGTVTYVHDGTEETFDTFTYTIRDRQGQVSNTATVAITIADSNVAPTANDDAGSVLAGGSVTINLTTNDSDPENQLDRSSIAIVENGTFGTVTVNKDGTIVYKHGGTDAGSDNFRYTIRDLQGKVSNEAVVSINILANSNPIANGDATTVARSGSVLIPVSDNDNDPENQLDLASVTIVDFPTSGTLTINGNGSVTYKQNGNAEAADQFTYTIRDLQGRVSEKATVEITITDTNAAPVAVADQAKVDIGQSVIINVASNDTDTEGQLDPSTIVIVAQPTNGTVSVNTDGTVKYTHNDSQTNTDSFKYTIRDLQGAVSNQGDVSISINVFNRPPIAKNDMAQVTTSKSITIDILANDTDPDNNIDPSKVTITLEPTRGSVTVNANGTVTYENTSGDGITDTFRYTVADTAGAISNEAVVNIQITPVIDPPGLTAAPSSEPPPPAKGDGEDFETEATPNSEDDLNTLAALFAARGTADPTVFSASEDVNGDSEFRAFRARYASELIV